MLVELVFGHIGPDGSVTADAPGQAVSAARGAPIGAEVVRRELARHWAEVDAQLGELALAVDAIRDRRRAAWQAIAEAELARLARRATSMTGCPLRGVAEG
jgi:hypothetical protein